MKIYFLAIIHVCSIHFLFAQVQDSTLIKEVVVKGENIQQAYQSSSLPFNFVSKQELSRSEPTIITPILNRVPGVFMQQGNLNTNRITIRGIGARSPFSTNRLKAYLGNIPLTNANGETILEDLDMEFIQHLEIIKGPNSTEYGSDIGGVIQLKPLQLANEEQFSRYGYLSGSYGLQKHSFLAGQRDENKQWMVSYHDLQQDGFRQNSNYRRQSLNVLSELFSKEGTSIEFLGVLTKIKAFIPSSITLEDLENNPRVAASNWNAAQGFESYTRGLLGATLKQQFSHKISNQTTVFMNFKNAYEPRPFDILDENTTGIGMRTNFIWKPSLFGQEATVQAGAEVQYEWYATANYDNLYQDFPDQGSVQGDLFFAMNQERRYQNYFATISFPLHSRLYFDAGIGVHTTSFEIQDRFLNDQENISSTHRFETAFNPRVGVNYQFIKEGHLYGNISRGFSVPTVSESQTPEGTLNTNLLPENAWNYEVGTKLNLFQNKLYTEVSLYSLQVDNLLVARRTAEDQFVGINAGQTSHRGIEAMVKGNVNHGSFLLQPYFSGSFNFFRFKEFVDEEEDYSGNHLTGVPDQVLNVGVDFVWNQFQLFSNWSYVGTIPLNDANALFSEAYQVFNVKATYLLLIAKRFQLQLNAGINNLFDERYAASILPNAVGFGNAAPRFYYPGLPRNYFFGAQCTYDF